MLIVVGSQEHLGAGTSRSTLSDGLNVLGNSGVSEVAITELDIPNAAANDYTAVSVFCLLQLWDSTDVQGCWRVSRCGEVCWYHGLGSA